MSDDVWRGIGLDCGIFAGQLRRVSVNASSIHGKELTRLFAARVAIDAMPKRSVIFGIRSVAQIKVVMGRWVLCLPVASVVLRYLS